MRVQAATRISPAARVPVMAAVEKLSDKDSFRSENLAFPCRQATTILRHGTGMFC